jgi:hypothetical protein
VITTIIDGTLTAEARPGQLTNELVRESARERLESRTMHPNMRAMSERVLEPDHLPRWGRYSNGNRFTMLAVEHEGRRLEISVTGDKLVDQAVELEVGTHYRLRARRIAAI